MRGLVHLTAALAVAAVAVAFGRWLRDPAPGGPVLALLAGAVVCVVALRWLYRPGGLGRRGDPAPVVAAVLERCRHLSDDAHMQALLQASARSYAWAWILMRGTFGIKSLARISSRYKQNLSFSYYLMR